MEKWKTTLQLKTQQEVMQSQPIQIQRGIFQRDWLSPLLFCTAFIPLTHELNRADCGYQVHGAERKINHLLYTYTDLENEIKIVKAISKDINMNFGLEKCAKMNKNARIKGGSKGKHT
jgi:hypothetical protein